MAIGDVDADGSSKISLVEFGQVFQKKHGRKMTETELDTVWAQLDKDGDGFVDTEEAAKLPLTTVAFSTTRPPSTPRTVTATRYNDNATATTSTVGEDIAGAAPTKGFKTAYLIATVVSCPSHHILFALQPLVCCKSHLYGSCRVRDVIHMGRNSSATWG